MSHILQMINSKGCIQFKHYSTARVAEFQWEAGHLTTTLKHIFFSPCAISKIHVSDNKLHNDKKKYNHKRKKHKMI